MRAFIGIDFSKELKDEIAGLQNKLRPLASAGRWKYIDNFHLTLKFLDDITPEQTVQIGELLKDISGKTRGFDLNISELGSFPGRGCLRVLWLGLGGDMDRLGRLQAEIESGLEKSGFEKEKRGYTPHVTIGQDLVFDRSFDEIKKLARVEAFPGIRVDSVTLFKSEQIGKKRVYTPVYEYRLGQL